MYGYGAGVGLAHGSESVLPARQRSFDELGTPLHEVTFCVFDLETTGGSPESCAITEIGAVLVRGGECLGTFQTLVNPGCAIPPEITLLTGISEAMVIRAPRIESVLPAFQQFCGDAVMVGHNVKFDLGFINAALVRSGREAFSGPSADTLALARRLVRAEVPNCKLSTLADQFRLDHRPSHRALDDALATCDLLHLLLERAGGLGVTGLDDLLALHRLANVAHASKLRLTDKLPRRPGVYVFRGGAGDVLYVGKATNLRQRVRSYFSTDDRRKVGSLLRVVQRIDHIECPSTLEAAVLEVRLIHRYLPHYNAQSKNWQRYCYVKLTLGERFPRLTVVKQVKDDGALYLGPVSSTSVARQVTEAIESVVPLRRCSGRPGRRGRPTEAMCTAAQLGVAHCPCTGQLDAADYDRVVTNVVHALRCAPELLLDPLTRRMEELARAARFEEAADVRDRAAALSRVLERQRRFDALRSTSDLRIELPGGSTAVLAHGVLRGGDEPTIDLTAPLPRELADEVSAVATWLGDNAERIRLVACVGQWAFPVAPLPTFTAVSTSGRQRASRSP
jgi:DNA polymerase III subunit epsilon